MVVATDEPQALGDVRGVHATGHHRGGEVAQQHQGAGAVAVVGLVAHLQHLGEDAGDVDRSRAAHRLLQQRTEHVAHPPQPGQHLRTVGAVPQHLAEALVERAVGTPARGGVLEREHPHAGRDDAGHRPDRRSVVARLERDARAGLEERGGVLGVVDQSLERGAAHQRAAHRTGRAVPADRRAGVQELAGLEPEQLAGRCDVDQGRGDAEHRGQGALVGVAPQRVGGHRREVGLGAGHRRAPVDPGHPDRLLGHRVGEQVRADVDDGLRGGHGGAHDSAPISSIARRVAPALERWTSAPASARARTCRSRSWGSASVPTTAITTG